MNIILSGYVFEEKQLFGFKNYYHIHCRSITYTKTASCFASTFFARCCCKICVGIQNNEK